MSALQEQSPSTRGFLDGARVIEVGPGGITIGVPSAMRVRMLEGPDHRRRLAHVVSLALGGAFPVVFEAVDTPASAPVVSEAPGLSQEEHDRVLRERMRELFGAVEESEDTAADRYGQQRGETKGAG